MKLVLLIFLVSFSLPLLSNTKKVKTENKQNWMKEYKSFLNQNSKLRMGQELRLYKKQREFLTTYYKKRMTHLKELAKIQKNLKWGNKKNNKKIMALITKKKEEFKKNSKVEREAFFQKDLKAEIDSFNRKMKQRRGLFSKKTGN
ncbi:MAG: hypothetical protein E2O68_03845 [Deltaproteobacteria bacterium]|nr:MAG: hypothetical protein E2O68_03845 [Deltaproteobacteria bacterium]